MFLWINEASNFHIFIVAYFKDNIIIIQEHMNHQEL
jgi:hypothetical protein